MKKITLMIVVLVFSSLVYSADVYWSGKSASTDNISDGTNWWSGVNPSSGDNLYFNNTGGFRHWVYSNYASGSWFGNIITYSGAGGIKLYGDNTYAFKFENYSDNNLFEIANPTIGNRIGNDLEINPVGDGGILLSGSNITIDGNQKIKVYGNKTLTVNPSINQINGTGSFEIFNSATVIFKSVNTYSGTTTINSGILELQADQSSTEIIVKSGAKLLVNGTDVDINYLTIESGGTLEIAAGKSLNINGNLSNNGTITIKNGATVITVGTITGSGTTNIEQSLTSGRQWWYLSSPVSAATSDVFAPTLSENKIGTYVEDYLNDGNESSTVPYYTNPYAAGSSTALSVGKGYVVKLSSPDGGTYTFTGGSLNNGDITIAPTRTGTSNAKRGFNLIGNPYPSYIDWDLLYDPASATNMRNAIWFRTWNGTAMDFHTYSDGDGVPDQASGKIAPMQGFWVKVDADGSNGSLTFKNAHRSHKAETGYNPLKVKATDDRQRVRLVLSDGTNSDETLIVGKSYASDSQDAYDIEKMSNESAQISEIYSMIGTETMVINSVAPITAGKTVALGIRSTSEKAYSITASQLQNIPTDVRVILVDAEAETETELSEGVSYNFVASAGAVNDRFSIQFRSPGATTLVDNDSKNKIFNFRKLHLTRLR
ncbi:MAG: hypothetical protein EOM47_10375 [Bacteroidia bacterium]|nr:hypothetical protein [Bacteroidia bacterium]